jgi:glyoxylase-like metal-dependent hydrolase (beta-lactamase superfamily II)
MFEIVGEVIFTGDVLFAGAIGRTDLPGGSAEDMARSLRDRVLPLSDELRLMPGHGPASTMKQERANNPYLTRLASGLSLL